MRAAEARRQASTITSSSIRLSFAGGQVDCRMKTSRPRTFSISSRFTSPSLKRPTYARPSGVCRPLAMSCASAGLALPANRASVSLVLISLCARLHRPGLPATAASPWCVSPSNWLGWKDSNLRMAGSKPAALPLGDTPAPVRPRANRRARILQPPQLPPPKLETLVQRRACSGRARRNSSSDPAPAPRVAPPAGRTRARGEHAGAGPGQLRGRLAGRATPAASATSGDLRPHHRLAVVPAARLKKGAYCDEGGISCQFRALEYLARCSRATPGCTMTYQVSGSVTGVSRSPTPSPQAERTLNKNRYIGAQGQPQGGKLRRPRGRSPRAHSAPGGPSPHPSCRPRDPRPGGCACAPAGSPRAAVPVAAFSARAARTTRSASGGTPGGPAGPLNLAVLAHAHAERVGKIDQLKECLQLVVAVGAAAGHVQEQIELRRRGPVSLGRRALGAPPPASITAASPRPGGATRTVSRSSVRRAGSGLPVHGGVLGVGDVPAVLGEGRETLLGGVERLPPPVAPDRAHRESSSAGSAAGYQIPAGW